jgi:excisionase family DNA binding protein
MSASLPEQLEQLGHAISAPELARLLNVHKLTIYRLAQTGTLPCFRVGTCVRFEPRAVADWLRERGLR